MDTADDCRAEYQLDPLCMLWTYVTRASADTYSHGRCFLKDRLLPPQTDQVGYISGPRDC